MTEDMFTISPEDIQPTVVKKQSGKRYRAVLLEYNNGFIVEYADKSTQYATVKEPDPLVTKGKKFTTREKAEIFFLCICERNEPTMTRQELVKFIHGKLE